MSTRSFAALAGFVYLALGIFGFLPGFIQSPPAGAPQLIAESNYAYLFGVFPVNLWHNLIHLVIGVWGFVASRNFGASRIFARSLAVIFGVLAVMGLFPGLHTTFGFIPLFGYDVWLHAGTALIAVYFGFAAPAAVTRVRRTNVKSDNVKVYEERPQV